MSMPSTGFYLFLQDITVTKEQNEELCQCPQRASTYFYLFSCNRNGLTVVLCQCPQRASTYFYGILSEALILLASEI